MSPEYGSTGFTSSSSGGLYRRQPEKHVEAATAGAVLGCLAGYMLSVGAPHNSPFYSQGIIWPEIIWLFLSLLGWWRPSIQNGVTRFLRALTTQFIATVAIIVVAYRGSGPHPRPFSDDEIASLFFTFFWLSVPAIIFSPISCAIGRWVLAQMREGGER